MTIDELIRMAHEAGWQYADGEDGYVPLWDFGKLVEAESAATEREAIIRLIDEMRHIDRDGVIDAIRARGQA
jgi:hypothetical protein